ncbi:MAG: APC family permease [Longimicrobiales bacterium]
MSRSLERVLSLRDLILLVIGAVIGSGIFIVPGRVLRDTDGRIGVALLVWLVAGVLSLLGALTYGELSAADPQSGGIYVYIRDAFGRMPAFLYGWTLLFMIAGGAVATLAVAFTSYLSQIVPVSGVVARLVSIAMIAVVMIINVRGTRQSADVQNVTTVIKAGAILIMGAVLLFSGDGFQGAGAAMWPENWSGSVFSGVLLAMISVLWAYEGWQFVTFSAGEAKDPQRTFPRGIMVGTLALILLYCFANIAYIAALGPQRVAATDTVAADAVGALLGPVAGKLIAATILISMFSAANSILLTTPRVYFAMARDGIFFRKLAEVHPRFKTPAIAVIVQALWAMGLAATGTFNQLLTYVVFTGWIFYALGAASIFVLRRTRPDIVRPFKVPGYPYTPALFVIASAIIVINTLITQPGLALVGLAFVLSGAPAYLIWRRFAGRDAGRVTRDEVAAGND